VNEDLQLKKGAGYVLAGGGSTRFGEDKARVIFAGKPMLSRIHDLVSGVTGTVHVVAPLGRYEDLGAPVIADRWPGEGPLGGIITALLNTRECGSDADWNLMVSCDMPFLTREWLTFLVARAAVSAADVLVPRSAHGLEPLCACWRGSSEPPLRDVFSGGVRKVTEALKHLRTEVLDEADWKRFDSAGRLFWNMNTAADYQEAQRMLAAEQT
jgi:molybdopterin-guanine dinucleotide biosynthesis protein A